jgi:hypothetical protein
MLHCKKVLSSLKEAQSVPIELLHMLVVDMNYLSEVTNLNDSANVHEIASVLIKAPMFAYGPGGQDP